jgi:uncharacterized protein (DUF433 family)
MTIHAEAPPLKIDDTGTIRVGGTRVTLDSVLDHYLHSYAAEQLAEAFPSISLGDIHSVIGYCLRHKEEVDSYLRRREQEAAEVRRQIEARQGKQPTKAELLARCEKKFGAPFPDRGTATGS